ncbi:MAG: glycosyltransferase family 4 protein [Verrucomicrobiaceae bacterium]|nr:glycosyltransferase family 4 protein [Verrucomicrobiaceae bacterium]
MKIALLHHQMIRGTAVEIFLGEFAKKLAAAGHEPIYITSLTTEAIRAELPGRWELLPRLRLGPLARKWHFDRAAPRAAEAAGADISIGFGRTTRQTIHRNGTGCHRLYGQLLPTLQRYSPAHLYELYLEKKLHTSGATTRYLTSSARVAAQLQGIYHTDGERFRILTPPVETQLFRPAENRASTRELICRKLHTDPAQRVLLFVSLSHKRRGLESLLEAMPQLDATLWIVGRGLSAATQARITQLGIAAKIRSVPVTSQLVELYQSADWFIHPTQYDAFSSTVLQSMACGLPGIISVMDGAVDHVRHEENGLMLYHPQQPVELGARIREALALPAARRDEMASAARQSVLPFTWERHLAEWEDVMRGV